MAKKGKADKKGEEKDVVETAEDVEDADEMTDDAEEEDVETMDDAETEEITPSEKVEPIVAPVVTPAPKIEPKIVVPKGPETQRVKFTKSIGPFFYGEEFFKFKGGDIKAIPKGMVTILLARKAIEILP